MKRSGKAALGGAVLVLVALVLFWDGRTFEECVREEYADLMTRWVSPLPSKEAAAAARERCR